jgi:hypothetical protein
LTHAASGTTTKCWTARNDGLDAYTWRPFSPKL